MTIGYMVDENRYGRIRQELGGRLVKLTVSVEGEIRAETSKTVKELNEY